MALPFSGVTLLSTVFFINYFPVKVAKNKGKKTVESRDFVFVFERFCHIMCSGGRSHSGEDLKTSANKTETFSMSRYH